MDHTDSRPHNARPDDSSTADPEQRARSRDAGEDDDDEGAGSARAATEPRGRDAVETAVPPDATAWVCERCGRPFARESYRALHRGLAHGGELTEAERAAYEAALDEERDDLRRFRILALGGLVLLYFGFLFAYALFT